MFPFSHFGEIIRTYIRSSSDMNMEMGNNRRERLENYEFQIENKVFYHPPYFGEISEIYFQMLPSPPPPPPPSK